MLQKDVISAYLCCTLLAFNPSSGYGAKSDKFNPPKKLVASNIFGLAANFTLAGFGHISLCLHSKFKNGLQSIIYFQFWTIL